MFSSARAGLPLRQGQREPPLSDNRVGSGLAAKVGFRLSTRVRPSISTRATAGMGHEDPFPLHRLNARCPFS